MSTPHSLVSCIIPNYNYGKYVAETIQSVLSQTYANIEIIVVDDGSTDNSLDILAKFQADIKIVTQRNQGVVVARNNGANQAQGEYLFFLDADDVIEPQFVEKLLQAMQQQNTDLAYCDAQYFGQYQCVITGQKWNVKKLLYRNYIIPAALIKTKAFNQVGQFSKDVNQKSSFEDWDLWLSLAEAGYSGAYVPLPLFKYRLHGKGRNVEALKQRRTLEKVLQDRHPKLYGKLENKAYLAIFRTASRIRNAIRKAPGT